MARSPTGRNNNGYVAPGVAVRHAQGVANSPPSLNWVKGPLAQPGDGQGTGRILIDPNNNRLSAPSNAAAARGDAGYTPITIPSPYLPPVTGK